MTSAPQFEEFGHYTLLHNIAISGMSEIYLAQPRDPAAPQQIVVVKRMKEGAGRDPEMVKMYVDEEAILGQLDHDSIIRALDFGKAQERYFIALEHVWGESLTTVCGLCQQKGLSFPLDIALYVGAEVADALAHAHGRLDEDGTPAPVIHRDVTINNVMLTYEGRVKVVDFGMAKTSMRLSNTIMGTVKGTLVYLAPEQIVDGRDGPLSDIYQLGVLLYKLTVGREPISAPDMETLIRTIVDGKIQKPSDRVANFPALVEKVLLKALDRRPERRFKDSAAMSKALKELLPPGFDDGQQRIADLMDRLAGDRHKMQAAMISGLLRREAFEPGAEALFTRTPQESEPTEVPAEISGMYPHAERVRDGETAGTQTWRPIPSDEIPFTSDVMMLPDQAGAARRLTTLAQRLLRGTGALPRRTMAIGGVVLLVLLLIPTLLLVPRCEPHEEVARSPQAVAVNEPQAVAAAAQKTEAKADKGATRETVDKSEAKTEVTAGEGDIDRAEGDDVTGGEAGAQVEETDGEAGAQVEETDSETGAQEPPARATKPKRAAKRSRRSPRPKRAAVHSKPPATAVIAAENEGDAATALSQIEEIPAGKRTGAQELKRGHALVTMGRPEQALDAYAAARDKGARDRQALDFVLNRLSSPQADRAAALLSKWPGRRVDRRLAEIARTGSWHARHRALHVLEDRGTSGGIDKQAVAIRDLNRGKTCDQRKLALGLLSRVGRDTKALEAIQAASRRMPDNLCMLVDLPVAEGKVRRRMGL